MPSGFVGREAELDRLSASLSQVGAQGRDLPGVALMLRGRRRVGKSRLVEVFCERSGLPFVFFQASQGVSAAAGREGFAEARPGGLVLLSIERSWGTWRGRAIEPVIREALLRIAPDLGYPEIVSVGGWWNRQHNPVIDIVAKADQRKAPIAFAGSIKWHASKAFGRREYADLVRDVPVIPGANDDTPLLAVSRIGTADDGVPIRCLGPDDLFAAWR